jgi:hypothetical protein
MLELCILKSGKSRESWRSGECITDGQRFHKVSGVYPDSKSPTASNVDTHVVIVLGQVRKW